MSVSISSTSQNVLVPTPASPRISTEKSDASEKSETSGQETVVISGEKAEALTYSKPRALPADLATMLDDSDQQVAEFMDFLRPLLAQQGLSIDKVATGEQKLSANQDTIDAAKEAIGQNSEWGVQKVSERVLGFAKLAIGGDASKLQDVRDMVEQGFSQAKDAMGGALPEISQKTHDAIMAEFDRWAKDGLPSDDTVSQAQPEVKSDTTVKA